MPGLSEVLTGKVDSDSVTLPVASYRFTFRVTMPIHFPEYAGSMIRGAFAVFVKILQKNWLGVFLSLKNLSRGFAPTLRYPRIFF